MQNVNNPTVVNLHCRNCHNPFDNKSRKPLLLSSCGHSICNACYVAIEESEKKTGRKIHCPQCFTVKADITKPHSICKEILKEKIFANEHFAKTFLDLMKENGTENNKVNASEQCSRAIGRVCDIRDRGAQVVDDHSSVMMSIISFLSVFQKMPEEPSSQKVHDFVISEMDAFVHEFEKFLIEGRKFLDKAQILKTKLFGGVDAEMYHKIKLQEKVLTANEEIKNTQNEVSKSAETAVLQGLPFTHQTVVEDLFETYWRLAPNADGKQIVPLTDAATGVFNGQYEITFAEQESLRNALNKLNGYHPPNCSTPLRLLPLFPDTDNVDVCVPTTVTAVPSQPLNDSKYVAPKQRDSRTTPTNSRAAALLSAYEDDDAVQTTEVPSLAIGGGVMYSQKQPNDTAGNVIQKSQMNNKLDDNSTAPNLLGGSRVSKDIGQPGDVVGMNGNRPFSRMNGKLSGSNMSVGSHISNDIGQPDDVVGMNGNRSFTRMNGKLSGSNISVGSHISNGDVQPKKSNQETTVFVENLPHFAIESALRAKFGVLGEIAQDEKGKLLVRKISDYCWTIVYVTEKSAADAVDSLNGSPYPGSLQLMVVKRADEQEIIKVTNDTEEPICKIKVSNLPVDVRMADVRDQFAQFGALVVNSNNLAKVNKLPTTGTVTSSTFIIEYHEGKSAAIAIRKMHGTVFPISSHTWNERMCVEEYVKIVKDRAITITPAVSENGMEQETSTTKILVQNVPRVADHTGLIEYFEKGGPIARDGVGKYKVKLVQTDGIYTGRYEIVFLYAASVNWALEKLDGRPYPGTANLLKVTPVHGYVPKRVKETDGDQRNGGDRIFVKNLPYEVSMEDIVKHFDQHARVVRSCDGTPMIRLWKDENGKFSGMCAIQYETTHDADLTKEKLNHHKFLDDEKDNARVLFIEKYHPRRRT